MSKQWPTCTAAGCTTPISYGNKCRKHDDDPLGYIFEPPFQAPKKQYHKPAAPSKPLAGLNGAGNLEKPVEAEVSSLDMDIDDIQDYLVSPFIRPADLIYLVGREGAGKTTLLCNLLSTFVDTEADECLDGLLRINRDFFNPNSDKILVVDGENSKESWAYLLNQVLRGRGIDTDSDRAKHIRRSIGHVQSDVFDLAQSEPKNLQKVVKRLANFIIESGHKIVVMDPIWNVFQPQGNGDSSWLTHGLRPFRNAIKDHGITLFVVAHPPEEQPRQKPKARLRPFGSSTQKGFTDVWWGLETVYGKTEKNNRVRLFHLKDRRAWWIQKESSVILKFSTDCAGGYDSVQGADKWPHDRVPTLSPYAQAVLDAIEPKDFRFNRDWCTANKFNYVTFAKTMKNELLEEGFITRTGAGHKGDPNIYSLSALGEQCRTKPTKKDEV